MSEDGGRMERIVYVAEHSAEVVVDDDDESPLHGALSCPWCFSGLNNRPLLSSIRTPNHCPFHVNNDASTSLSAASSLMSANPIKRAYSTACSYRASLNRSINHARTRPSVAPSRDATRR